MVEIIIFLAHRCQLFNRPNNSSTYARLVVLPVAATVTYMCMLSPLLQMLQVPSLIVWTGLFVLKDLFCSSWDSINTVNELTVTLYWLALLLLTTSGAYFAAEHLRWTKTCARKIFHFLVVLLFAPLIAASCTLHIPLQEVQHHPLRAPSLLLSYLVFCLAIALQLFLLLEYVRMELLPTLTPTHRGMFAQAGQAINRYMRLFVHGRNSADGSPAGIDGLETAHISLLVGSASSIWFYAALCLRPLLSLRVPQHTASGREWLLLSLLPHLGLISIGIGDACAAVAGSLYGQRRWRFHLTDWLHAPGVDSDTESTGSRRTYLGSCACFASMISACVLLLYLNHHYYDNHIEAYAQQRFDAVDACVVIAAVTFTLLMTTLAEAFTQENDNIILPLYCTVLFTAIVRCCT